MIRCEAVLEGCAKVLLLFCGLLARINSKNGSCGGSAAQDVAEMCTALQRHQCDLEGKHR